MSFPILRFIKGDDIEFSLRNSSKIITLNGLSVWHEDFQKKYSSFFKLRKLVWNPRPASTLS